MILHELLQLHTNYPNLHIGVIRVKKFVAIRVKIRATCLPTKAGSCKKKIRVSTKYMTRNFSFSDINIDLQVLIRAGEAAIK